MPTAAAAFAWPGRAPISATLRILSRCSPTAWSAITARRRISWTSRSAPCCTSGLSSAGPEDLRGAGIAGRQPGETAGYSGAGIAPAENHILLLEDEPSHCLREGMVWKLKEVDLQNNAG